MYLRNCYKLQYSLKICWKLGPTMHEDWHWPDMNIRRLYFGNLTLKANDNLWKLLFQITYEECSNISWGRKEGGNVGGRDVFCRWIEGEWREDLGCSKNWVYEVKDPRREARSFPSWRSILLFFSFLLPGSAFGFLPCAGLKIRE